MRLTVYLKVLLNKKKQTAKNFLVDLKKIRYNYDQVIISYTNNIAVFAFP